VLPAAGGAEVDPLASLRAFEEARRSAADFAKIPASDKAMGSDPYAIRAAPGRRAFVSILRGADALVGLDASLREIARLPAPASPSGLAVSASGDPFVIFVTGELDPKVARYMWQGEALKRAGEIQLAGVKALRDVATGPEGVLYLVEEHGGRIITLLPERPGGAEGALSFDPAGSPQKTSFERVDAEACAGAFRVARAGDFVIVDCLIDHELLIRRVNDRGLPLREGEVRIRHDGPILSFDAAARGDDLVIAAGGVEDRPLDRAEGSFGYIDSFVFLYEVSPGRAAPVKRLAEVNVSELGVVNPKALRLDLSKSEARVRVSGYGGDKLATLEWKGDPGGALTTKVIDLPPGTTSMAAGAAGDGSLALASPLLDAWVMVDKNGNSTVVKATGGSEANQDVKLGEALFFTSLMAPWNKTEGRLSRFTCETCHFEGYVDGRTHHTGRGDIRATTKPLLGLFNNRPHFSRALDPDLSAVAHNEFRAAGAKSGRDPWFSINPGDYPWLQAMGAAKGDPIGPEALRKSLMAFLMAFSHRPNPAAAGRASFSPLERRGAEVFRARCEGCHSARLAADDPRSSVPFDRWEALIFAREGPIVWARSEYKQTGVTPYVHEKGARVPSLRRLYKKRPYLTNGSARTLADVLSMARFKGEDFWFYHASAPEDAKLSALTADEREALLAFLDLL
jgi:hypothetical protein